MPSAIFAAVPRTPTSLSQTWPKRAPSPIARAISEVGNVGRVAIGAGISERPPPSLPQEESGSGVSGRDNVEEPEVLESFSEEEGGYETVKTNRESFDKTTKYYRMQNDGLLHEGENGGAGRSDQERGNPEEGETSGQQGGNFYNVLEHENSQVVDPTYSRVDKTRKSRPVSPEVQLVFIDCLLDLVFIILL